MAQDNAKDSRVTTEVMLNRLKAAPSIGSFLEENQDSFLSGPISAYVEHLLKKYGVSKSEAIERADIERSYGYQIIRGIRAATRDKYIRLAIGMRLNLEDTQRLLTVAKHGILYTKTIRDAVIIFAVNNGYDLVKLQLLLYEQKLDILE